MRGLLAIAVALQFFAAGRAHCEAPTSVALDDFLRGVLIREQARFRVTNILVRSTSVMPLFMHIPWQEPSAKDYYRQTRKELTLRIGSEEKLAELRRLLSVDGMSSVTVVMRDEADSAIKAVPGLKDPSRYTRVYQIAVRLPTAPCAEITRIVYDAVNTQIKGALLHLEGQTERRINLNELFDLLLREEVETFMKKELDPVKSSDPCFRTFELWKWLHAEEGSGFQSGKYRLHKGLQDLLAQVVAALNEARSSWESHNLSLRITGYTDPVLVKKGGILLRFADTGIDDWSGAGRRWNVWYRGCSGEKFGGTPRFVAFGGRGGSKVPPTVTSNCELGAVRAYVATVHLMNELRWTNVESSYATGGVRPAQGPDERKDTPRRRAVEIEITIKAARRGNSNGRGRVWRARAVG